ncbi:DUF6266 family protein [Pedobacter africanus]|uniref:Uncharacterized protein n=1 Tax=Pedobacter africanus TaxID=151894 RepID=A0A1W2CUM7_9SPHI|nr:DUF6266 family protein [Pedobacter africanus]SMC88930.1 hypothetical protein SAMN04488524_3260 [Pedobacter africanus]
MAVYNKGIFGACKGKIGKLVFYELNGKQVVRTQGKHNRQATVLQLQNRAELNAVMQFLKPIREFVNAGFEKAARGSTKSAYNVAVSYNKRNAVTGTYPDVTIRYESAGLTEGTMNRADAPAVELTTAGLSFSWACPPDLPWPRPNDQVMLLAYFPELQSAEYILYGVARFECAAILSLPAALLTEHMEVYISFIAQDRKQVANSSYLGRFN